VLLIQLDSIIKLFSKLTFVRN